MAQKLNGPINLVALQDCAKRIREQIERLDAKDEEEDEVDEQSVHGGDSDAPPVQPVRSGKRMDDGLEKDFSKEDLHRLGLTKNFLNRRRSSFALSDGDGGGESDEEDCSSSDSDFLVFHPSDLRKIDENFNVGISRTNVKELLSKFQADERTSLAERINEFFASAAANASDIQDELNKCELVCTEQEMEMEEAHRELGSHLQSRDLKTIQQMRRFYDKIQELRPKTPPPVPKPDQLHLGSAPRPDRHSTMHRMIQELKEEQEVMESGRGGSMVGQPGSTAAGQQARTTGTSHPAAAPAAGPRGTALGVPQGGNAVTRIATDVSEDWVPEPSENMLNMAQKRGARGGVRGANELLGSLRSSVASAAWKQDKPWREKRSRKRQTVGGGGGFLASDLLEVIAQQQDEIAHLKTRSDFSAKGSESMRVALEFVRSQHEREETAAAAGLASVPSWKQAAPIPEAALEVLNDMRDNLRVKVIGEYMTSKDGREILRQAEAANPAIASQIRSAELMEEVEKLHAAIKELEAEVAQTMSPAQRIEILKQEIDARTAELDRKRRGDAPEGSSVASDHRAPSPAGSAVMSRPPSGLLAPGRGVSPGGITARPQNYAWLVEAPESLVKQVESIFSEVEKGMQEIQEQRSRLSEAIGAAKLRIALEEEEITKGTVNFKDTKDDEQLDELRSKVKVAQQDLMEVRTEAQALQKEEDELRTELKRLRESKKKTTQAIAAATREEGRILAGTKKSIKPVSKQNDKVSSTNSNKESREAGAAEGAEGGKDTSTPAGLQKSIDRLQGEVQDADAEIESLDAQRAQLLARIDRLRKARQEEEEEKQPRAAPANVGGERQSGADAAPVAGAQAFPPGSPSRQAGGPAAEASLPGSPRHRGSPAAAAFQSEGAPVQASMPGSPVQPYSSEAAPYSSEAAAAQLGGAQASMPGSPARRHTPTGAAFKSEGSYAGAYPGRQSPQGSIADGSPPSASSRATVHAGFAEEGEEGGASPGGSPRARRKEGVSRFGRSFSNLSAASEGGERLTAGTSKLSPVPPVDEEGSPEHSPQHSSSPAHQRSPTSRTPGAGAAGARSRGDSAADSSRPGSARSGGRAPTSPGDLGVTGVSNSRPGSARSVRSAGEPDAEAPETKVYGASASEGEEFGSAEEHDNRQRQEPHSHSKQGHRISMDMPPPLIDGMPPPNVDGQQFARGPKHDAVVVDKREEQVQDLLMYQSEHTRLERQIADIEERIREAKLKALGKKGGKADSRPSTLVKSLVIPEENRAMRKEVTSKQRELNMLRKRWWTEKSRQGGASEDIFTGQAEAVARMLLLDPPEVPENLSENADDSDESSSSEDSRPEPAPPANIGRRRTSVMGRAWFGLDAATSLPPSLPVPHMQRRHSMHPLAMGPLGAVEGRRMLGSASSDGERRHSKPRRSSLVDARRRSTGPSAAAAAAATAAGAAAAADPESQLSPMEQFERVLLTTAFGIGPGGSQARLADAGGSKPTRRTSVVGVVMPPMIKRRQSQPASMLLHAAIGAQALSGLVGKRAGGLAKEKGKEGTDSDSSNSDPDGSSSGSEGGGERKSSSSKPPLPRGLPRPSVTSSPRPSRTLITSGGAGAAPEAASKEEQSDEAKEGGQDAGKFNPILRRGSWGSRLIQSGRTSYEDLHNTLLVSSPLQSRGPAAAPSSPSTEEAKDSGETTERARAMFSLMSSLRSALPTDHSIQPITASPTHISGKDIRALMQPILEK